MLLLNNLLHFHAVQFYIHPDCFDSWEHGMRWFRMRYGDYEADIMELMKLMAEKMEKS